MMLKEAEGEEKVKIGPRWSDSQNWKKGAGKGSKRDSFFCEGAKEKGKKGNLLDKGALKKDEGASMRRETQVGF